MKNFIELKYHKNSKQEIVFENLEKVKENRDKVILFLNGDLSPLFYLGYGIRYKIDSLFIPYLPKIDDLAKIEIMYRDGFGQPFAPYIVTLDSCFESDDYFFKFGHKNILPKWNIPEDSAVLFLNYSDKQKYKHLYPVKYASCVAESKHQHEIFVYKDSQEIRQAEFLMFLRMTPSPIADWGWYEKISLIIPELHAEDKSCQYHIENINKVCKELKEKYRVERIELFVSHCFIDKYNKICSRGEYCESIYQIGIFKTEFDGYSDFHKTNEFIERLQYIDKITTTNSTSILEVQKSDRLEVVDCVEFFKDNLLNIKQSI